MKIRVIALACLLAQHVAGATPEEEEQRRDEMATRLTEQMFHGLDEDSNGLLSRNEMEGVLTSPPAKEQGMIGAQSEQRLAHAHTP